MKLERDAFYFIAGFIFITLFFLLMGAVLSGSLDKIDLKLFNILSTNHNDAATQLFTFFTTLFGNTLLFVLCIFTFMLFYRARIWKDGILLGCSLTIAFFLGSFFKVLVSRARPELSFIEETGFSFPSGHALKVTLFVALFVFLYTESIPSFIGRKALLWIGSIVIFLTIFSRLYFGVHWVSDVVGGFLLGAGIFCFSAWFRIKYDKLF